MALGFGGCAFRALSLFFFKWVLPLATPKPPAGSQSGVIRFLRYDEGLPGKLHSAWTAAVGSQRLQYPLIKEYIP